VVVKRDIGDLNHEKHVIRSGVPGAVFVTAAANDSEIRRWL
jgi:hypothetical protein